MPVSFPSINAQGGKIAFVSGDYYQSQIHRYSLETGESDEVISSKFKLKLPKTSKKELLVTSKESGITQIYAYANNTRYQLSSFKVNRKIVDFVSSEDQQWLAIYFATSTTLYKRDSRGLSEVKRFSLMTHPAFSPSSQRLLLSDQSGIQASSRIVEYDLSGFNTTGLIDPTGLVVNDARFGVYHRLGIIYTPQDNQGIYVFSVGSNSLINGDIQPINSEGFGLTDNLQ